MRRSLTTREHHDVGFELAIHMRYDARRWRIMATFGRGVSLFRLPTIAARGRVHKIYVANGYRTKRPMYTYSLPGGSTDTTIQSPAFDDWETGAGPRPEKTRKPGTVAGLNELVH